MTFIDPSTVPQRTLYTGVQMPAVGMGTFGSDHADPDAVSASVAGAIRVGYRSFDCAACYGNEDQIGKVFQDAFAEGIVKREELFIASKVWNDMHGDGDVLLSLGVYGRLAPLGVKPFEYGADHRVEIPVGIEDDDCVGGNVKVAVAPELDGAREPESGGDNEVASASAFQLFESLAESVGTQADAVSLGSEIGQADAVVGNRRPLDIRHIEGKIFVKVSEFALGCRAGCQGGKSCQGG